MRLLRYTRTLASVGLVILSACPRRYAAWLEVGPQAQAISVAVGRERGDREGIDVGYFAVASCTDHDAAIQQPGQLAESRLARLPWAIVRAVDAGDVQRIVYGVVPAGYRQLSRAAAPLGAGCYVAEVYGAHGGHAYVRFEIDGAGSARELQ
jgi:hypothetical protein